MFQLLKGVSKLVTWSRKKVRYHHFISCWRHSYASIEMPQIGSETFLRPGLSVGLSKFLKRAESFAFMLLSEHMFHFVTVWYTARGLRRHRSGKYTASLCSGMCAHTNEILEITWKNLSTNSKYLLNSAKMLKIKLGKIFAILGNERI